MLLHLKEKRIGANSFIIYSCNISTKISCNLKMTQKRDTSLYTMIFPDTFLVIIVSEQSHWGMKDRYLVSHSGTCLSFILDRLFSFSD